LRKKALETIIPLYRQRKTREEIAAITGYNIGYVGEIIGASGEVGLHRRDVEDKYRRILAELDSGKSYRQVCKIIGCDKKTVWRAVKWGSDG
jgi:DNA invertase Pin-like site-specific DNA recombinase